MSQVSTLFLDLGNVLIFHDNDRMYRALGEACGRTPNEIGPLIHTARGENWINVTDCPPHEIYEAVREAIGYPGSFDEFAAIWNGIFTPNTEIVPLLDALHGRVRLFVLSNTNALHMAYIRPRLPVLRLFDRLFTSYELGVVKPDAAIYRRALELAGCDAAQSAFFDDLAGHVQGAEAVGMRGFVFTDAAGFRRDLEALGLLDGTARASSRRETLTPDPMP